MANRKQPKNALRCEGDARYDVHSFARPILEEQLNHQLRTSLTA
jgi:hypothetical protein